MSHKTFFLMLLLSLSSTACIHERDYADDSLDLTEHGTQVMISNKKMVAKCQATGIVEGKGRSESIEDAVANSMKDGQNKAALSQANAIVYKKTDVIQRWRAHFITISFDSYQCPATSQSNSQETATQAQVSAAAQGQIAAQQAAALAAQQAAALAAQQAAAQAAQQAAAQAAAQAASQAAAQAASQAAMQSMMMPPIH